MTEDGVTQYHLVRLPTGVDGNPPLVLVEGVPSATCSECAAVERAVLFINYEPYAICSCSPPETAWTSSTPKS